MAWRQTSSKALSEPMMALFNHEYMHHVALIIGAWINNMLSLVQKMAWRQTSSKALSEPMMALFNYEYMHHLALIIGAWTK